jgi:hypothetical protein
VPRPDDRCGKFTARVTGNLTAASSGAYSSGVSVIFVTINEYLLILLAGDRFFFTRNVRSGFNLWNETIFLIGDYIGLSSVKVE